MARKILIFSTAYHPFVGGAEVAVKEITDRITEFEFDLITARFDAKLPKFEKVGNVNVYRIGFGLKTVDKLLLPFLGALKVLTLGRKNKYFCYWCVMVSFASGAAYIANFFNHPKVPIILTLQEGDSESHLTHRWFGLLNLSWKLALKYASEVAAISSYLAERARRLGYEREVKIIPNGVDLNIFKRTFNLYGWNNAASVLNNNEIGYFFLWTFSRLTEKNGIKDIIKAIQILNGEFKLHNKFKLLIVGDGLLKNELIKLSEKLGVRDQVIFLGYKNQKEIVDLILKESNKAVLFKSINVWHIFVRPSLSEGFGNAFIEAMSVGIPIIATRVGGIPDFLKDHDTGLFCNINDPQSIASSVMEYINSPKLTEKITENAYKMVVEKYDWDLVAKKMQEVFNKLLR